MTLAGQWNEMPSSPTLWQVTDWNVVAPLRVRGYGPFASAPGDQSFFCTVATYWVRDGR